jgi:hypothetical protein
MRTKTGQILLLLLLAFTSHLRVLASSFLRFRDHTQRRTTVGRTPLDEWSARRRDYLTNTHHSQQTNIHAPGGIRTRNCSRLTAADPRLRLQTWQIAGGIISLPWWWRQCQSPKRRILYFYWCGCLPEETSFSFVAVKASRHVTVVESNDIEPRRWQRHFFGKLQRIKA